MEKTNVLAFDFGASSGRAILGTFDGKTLTLRETHRFSNDPVALNSSLYWDFPRLFWEIKNGILNTVNHVENDISSVGIDTWGVDFGLLDENGDLIGNPYRYRDSRTEGIIEKSTETACSAFVYSETGIQQIWFNTLYQLLAMKYQDSPQLKIAKKLLFIPDLFNYMLTGVQTTEYTVASTSQLLNPYTCTWSESLMDKLGLNKSLFTDITPAGTIIGKFRPSICEELGIEAIPVVAVASHDTGSAIASVPFDDVDTSAYISCGTWSLLGMELKKPCTSEKAAKFNFTNEGGIQNTTRFLKNIMGLWIIQECRRQWKREGKDISFAELEQMAWESEPLCLFIDIEDQLFAPPGNMPRRIREFCEKTGQKAPETKGAIIRCVAESLALKYRVTIENMEDTLGKKIETINMVGGGIKDKMVCQFTANSTGRMVKAGPVEATAAGNVIVQLMALGKIKSLEEARTIIKASFDNDTYTPKDTYAWQAAYERFRTIIQGKKTYGLFQEIYRQKIYMIIVLIMKFERRRNMHV